MDHGVAVTLKLMVNSTHSSTASSAAAAAGAAALLHNAVKPARF